MASAVCRARPSASLCSPRHLFCLRPVQDKRKALTASDEAVLECGELLGEVGSGNYSFVIGQGLPLLSAKELEEK